MDNKKIGLFISELRKEQGLNQRQLAEKLSVTDKAVSKWETGRGVPDVSILQPLANVFGVTVGELLNGERMPMQENNDEQLIKRLKVKRYIRLIIEVIITATSFFVLYMFYNTYNGYKNVLDFYLHKNEIMFLSVCTLIYMAVIAVWILTVIITAVLKRKASVFKTIIICLAVFLVTGCSVHMAVMEDSRFLKIYDEPVDTVSFIKYDDFFDDEFETQISIKDTNETITENYSAYFDSKGEEYNFVYTECVTACEYDIIKQYFNQRMTAITDNADYYEMDKNLCESFGISDGYYITNLYSENDIELHFIKGTSYYTITISNININNEKLVKAIINL